jgi:diaminopimelate decarboxylase
VLGRLGERRLSVWMEPGRAICANAGLFVTRVEFLKDNGHKHFAVVDGAMNDLIRPALYGAWQEIVPVVQPAADVTAVTCDVVGPVCETGDFLGKDRELAVRPGELLAVRSAGAYGFVMSSNYNTRPRAAEVMVDGGSASVVRRRETLADLLALESLLP